ncbi:MAG: cytochrome c biogenesis protein CcdA [Pseudomonadota bacterium]
MPDVTITSAFLAGLISFISPCVLPLVPPYLAYLAGVSFSELSVEDERRIASGRIVASAVLFVLGFTTVFVLLGASASLIGQAVTQYFNVLATIAGIIIILMGLHFLGLFKIGLLYREARFQMGHKSAGLWSAYIIGLAFAFGWTPCVGPVLAAILFMAGAEETVLQGSVLLAVYSLGIGLPFILAAIFAPQFIRWMTGFKRHLGTVEKVTGGLLVVTGVLFLTGAMPVIAFWFLELFPELAHYG